MFLQWSTFPCHRWGTCGLYLKFCHYDMPFDGHAKWRLHQRRSAKYMSLSQRVVAYIVRLGRMSNISIALDPQMCVVMAWTR